MLMYSLWTRHNSQSQWQLITENDNLEPIKERLASLCFMFWHDLDSLAPQFKVLEGDVELVRLFED